MRCSRTTKAGKPCSMHAITGEDYCIAHSPDAVALAKRANQASVAARRDAKERRKQASEEAKLSLTERVRRWAAEHQDEIVESLGKAAVADGSSAAMRELLNRVEGKVADHHITQTADPFEMNQAELEAWLRDTLEPAND